MQVQEMGGYCVGQRGQIDVLNGTGNRRFRVEGEIVRLIPLSDGPVYALIATGMGLGVYRVW